MKFMTDGQVSIIILNLNGQEHLARCLPSIEGQTYQNVEVILVDNGSSDGSIEYVRQTFPHVKIIANDHNTGFAKANNQGIIASNAPFIFTLNNDTWLDPNCVEEVVRVAEANERVGMIATKMLQMDFPQLIDSAGLDLDRTGFGWSRYHGQPDNSTEQEPYEIFAPCAGAALYKRKMLDEIGLFDEGYFIYYEDMDLAWRAQLRGWHCLYVPKAKVYHAQSATTGRGSPFKRYLLSRNRIWTVIKNYPSPQLWFYLPQLIFYDWLAMVYRIWLEKNCSPVRGRLAALTQLGQMWRQRQALQTKRSISWRELHDLMVPPVRLVRYRHWS